jgi:hypothetical protein
MKKAVPVFLFAVLIAVFGFQARSADAYPNAGTCATCHTFGSSGSTFHQGHLNMGLPDSCLTCHNTAPGDNPDTANCAICHFAPGLPLHHDNAGVGANCVSCHEGTPVPENTPVPGYATLTAATLDPCNGSEERFTSFTISLDNDGDLLYDGDDTDCQAAAPQIDVSPPSKDYGDVTIGSSASQVFTISNAGTANLEVTDGVLSDETNFILDLNGGGTPCGDTGDAPLTITPGDSCTVSIAFSPQSVDTFSATVTVTSNDTTNSPLIVDLSGSGVTGPAPNLAVTPTSIDFGEVNVGDTPATEVILSNTGTDNLAVTNIALDNAAVYSLDETGGTNPCNTLTPTIVPNDNCTLDVIFAPGADGGPFTATMTITSNVPDVDVPLTGTGFLDTDGDGVGDSVDEFPNDPTKATPEAATGTGPIVVDAGSNALSMTAAVAVAPGQTVPSGFSFPDGLVTFQVAVAAPGDNAVVTLMFPSGTPSGGKYFKDDGTGTLVEFAGATINTDNVVLLLTDGGSGDTDNTADGVITDPGGLATPVSSGGGGGGGSCSVLGSGGYGGGGAVLFLTLLAILVTLRRKGARARR